MGVLLCSLPLQSLADQIQQSYVALSSVCLDWAENQLALHALELLTDLDRARLGIDVSPAHAQSFTATQAVEDEQHERGVQRVGPSRTEELLGLVSGPRPNSATLPLRQFDQAGDVARDQFLANRSGEGCAEHGSHDLHLAHRITFL